MASFVRLGRFFWRLGVASFFVSLLLYPALAAYGVEVPPLAIAVNLFGVAGLTAALLGVLSKGGAIFEPAAKVAGIAFYLSMVLPAAAGIINFIHSTVSYLPLPAAAKTAICGSFLPVALFSIHYYTMFKLGWVVEA